MPPFHLAPWLSGIRWRQKDAQLLSEMLLIGFVLLKRLAGMTLLSHLSKLILRANIYQKTQDLNGRSLD